MGEERSKLQKTLLIVLPLIVVFFSIIYIYQTNQKGVLISGDFFKENIQENKNIYTGRIHYENSKIVVEKKNDNTSLISIDISDKYNKQ